jgi:hypothetical protein
MEPCAEHSGLVVEIRSIKDRLSSIEDKQDTTNIKLDAIGEQLNVAKINLETEKVEGKWRQRTSAGVWGVAGGAATYILTKVFGKYL